MICATRKTRVLVQVHVVRVDVRTRTRVVTSLVARKESTCANDTRTRYYVCSTNAERSETKLRVQEKRHVLGYGTYPGGPASVAFFARLRQRSGVQVVSCFPLYKLSSSAFHEPSPRGSSCRWKTSNDCGGTIRSHDEHHCDTSVRVQAPPVVDVGQFDFPALAEARA